MCATFGATTRVVGAACAVGGQRQRQLRRAPFERDRRRHAHHLQRRRLHASLADRRRADGQVVADLRRRRDRARRGPGDVGGVVEPEPLGDADEPRCPERGAQRREHRVAGDRERLRERPAAILAVGVLELDAAQRRRRRVGIRGLRRGDLRLERPGQREDLHRRAGRLQARERDPGEGEDLAGAGAHRHDAAEAPRQRGDRGALDGRRDRRAHGLRPLRLGVRQHPRAGEQVPARAAADAAPAGSAAARTCRPARPPGSRAPSAARRPRPASGRRRRRRPARCPAASRTACRRERAVRRAAAAWSCG